MGEEVPHGLLAQVEIEPETANGFAPPANEPEQLDYSGGTIDAQPSALTQEAAEDVEEERRLFHVALTRIAARLSTQPYSPGSDNSFGDDMGQDSSTAWSPFS